MLSLLIYLVLLPGARPRVLHHYRGHKMSIWLSLIPQLQKTGQNSIYPSHNSLLLDGHGLGSNGPSWGVVRNSSGSMMANIDNKAKNSLNPPSTTCMTLSDSTQVHRAKDPQAEKKCIIEFEAAEKKKQTEGQTNCFDKAMRFIKYEVREQHYFIVYFSFLQILVTIHG